MARGKYVVKTGSSGLYRFNLYASNGRVVATSRSFPSAQACLRGMEALRAACGTADLEDQSLAGYTGKTPPKFELYVDRAGEFRFRLRLSGGEILISSEGYLSKSNCLRGIRSVCRHAPLADLLWEE